MNVGWMSTDHNTISLHQWRANCTFVKYSLDEHHRQHPLAPADNKKCQINILASFTSTLDFDIATSNYSKETLAIIAIA